MNSVYLNMLLLSLLGSQELSLQWWNSPNKAFNYECPKDVSQEMVTNYLEGFAFK
jgi:hypothetical protein